jgi:hypothetical protein
MLRFISLIAIITTAFAASAKIRTDEIDYKASIIKYYHSGSKIKIKLKGLPYNTTQVTISPINTQKRPKVFIIGSRNHIPENDGSIQFTIELEDLKPGSYNTKSSEISLTLFSYDDNKLATDEKAKLFIRPIICSDDGDGICATVEVECHKGHANCKNHREDMTFKNLCEMKKQEGVILHTGPCVVADS